MTKSLETVAAPAVPPPLHLDYLDSVRALAALWVVLLHAMMILFPFVSVKGGAVGLATHWLKYGHLAVDIFIVLSGFCLIIPVAPSGSLKGSPWAFYARRARRILPPYYAGLGLCLVVGLILRQPPFGFGKSLVGRTVLTNLLLLQDVCHARSDQLNPPLWSVALEWQIYFLFPGLVRSLRRYGMAVTLGASACLGYSLIAVLYLFCPGLTLETTCPWYIFLFTLGLCAGWICFGPQQLAKAPWWAGVGSALVVGLGVLLWMFPNDRPTPDVISAFEVHEPLIDAVAGALMATMLILLSRQQPGLIAAQARRWLSWPPLVWLGTMSYSIYLLHWPLLRIFWWMIYVPPLVYASIYIKALLFLGVVLPVMGVLCYIFFIVCERPWLNRRKRQTLMLTATPAVLEPVPTTRFRESTVA